MVLLYSLHNNVVVFSQFESTSATKGKQFFAYFCEIIEEFDLVIEKHHYSPVSLIYLKSDLAIGQLNKHFWCKKPPLGVLG